MPMVVHCEQTVEECYCDDNSLPVKLILNKTTYTPSENLMYEINIFNKSYRDCERNTIDIYNTSKGNNEHVIYQLM